MITRNVFLIIACLSLIVFTILIMSVFIPLGFLGYDFGINLISEIIGLIFTIIFLTVLLGWTERKEWKSVKNWVNVSMEGNLDRLLRLVLTYTKRNYGLLGFSYFIMSDKKRIKERYLIGLRKLIDTQTNELETDKLINDLESNILLEKFEDITRDINEAEIKYSQFLSPQLTYTLISLRGEIYLLKVQLESYIKQQRMLEHIKTMSTKGKKELAIRDELFTDYTKNMFFQISCIFKIIIEKIYEYAR